MELRARSLPYGEVKCERGLGVRRRLHAHDLLVLGAVEGEGRALYLLGDDTRAELREGGLLIFAPGTPHRLLSIDGTILRYRVLHIDLLKLLPKNGSELTFRSRLYRDSTLYRDFNELCDALLYDHKPDDAAEAIKKLLNPLAKNGVASTSSYDSTKDLHAVRRALECDLESPFDLDILARRFGYNRYTLIRHFKSRYGLTPRQFHLNCRVHRVRELLAKGMEISEAALECGFYDQSHLYPYFHGVFGVPPARYRNALKTTQ